MIHAVLVKLSGLVQSKISCNLSVHGESLVLTDPDAKTELAHVPTKQAQFKVGGNNDSLLFMTSAFLDGQTVYFELNRENIQFVKRHADFYNIARPFLKIKSSSGRQALLVVTAIATLIATIIFYRSHIFGGLAYAIPFSAEKKVADLFIRPLHSAEQLKVLEQIQPQFERLKFDPEEWAHPFTFHISSETVPNAYATVGGHIFINKGLITSFNSLEDLLGVVAHEIIHVQQRHVAKSVAQAVGLFATLSLFLGDVSGIGAVVVDQGGPLLNLQYSRSLEDEADSRAVDLLVQNSVNPLGLGRGLSIIRDKQNALMRQSPGGGMIERLNKIELLNSHPDIDLRIEKINTKGNKLMGDKKIPALEFDYNAWKEAVQAAY